MPAAGSFYGRVAGITGSWYGGNPLGERGADVAIAGPEGPSLLGLDVQLPAEAEDLFRAVVLTIPPGLTLFAVDKYSRVDAEGSPGTYVGSKQGYRFNVPYGEPKDFTIIIGATGIASGTVQLDGPGVQGGASMAGPSEASGSMTLDGPTVDGGAAGYVEPVAVIGDRVVIVGQGWNPKILAPLVAGEIDDIAFRFAGRLEAGETVLGYTSTCNVKVAIGVQDLQPDPLRVGGPGRFGSDAIQRVDAARGVAGVTYQLRVVALLSSGRTVVGSCFIKVV